MLTESFIAATETVKPAVAHLSSNLKDVGIFQHEFQPQLIFRQGYKKSSVAKNCLAISITHIFAAQVGKAVIHVYNRSKANQEATVPFPEKISSLAFADEAATLIIGTQDGKLILWEVSTGRVSTSSASHIDAVTSIVICKDGNHIISASADGIHVWSLRELVAITASQRTSGSSASRNAPVASFTQHRSAVNAIATSHSLQLRTSFAVSASEDKTCYIWNVETQEVLRTILLTQAPECIVIDPADRAIYFGTTEGGVQQVDLLAQQVQMGASVLETEARVADTALQLRSSDCFVSAQSADVGSTQCICISYDGTRLLAGHHSGKISQWDVAKRRQAGEMLTLSGQSVTAIHMLRPDGLPSDAKKYIVQSVVKPNLELSSSGDGKIPPGYVLHAQVMQHKVDMGEDIDVPMLSTGFPRDMLDAAVYSLTVPKTTVANDKSLVDERSSKEMYNAEMLQQELALAKERLAETAKLEEERIARYINRRRRREDIALQKRQAFFSAQKSGQNGDAAMESFTQLQEDIDVESEKEAISSNGHLNGHTEVSMS